MMPNHSATAICDLTKVCARPHPQRHVLVALAPPGRSLAPSGCPHGRLVIFEERLLRVCKRGLIIAELSDVVTHVSIREPGILFVQFQHRSNTRSPLAHHRLVGGPCLLSSVVLRSRRSSSCSIARGPGFASRSSVST